MSTPSLFPVQSDIPGRTSAIWHAAYSCPRSLRRWRTICATGVPSTRPPGTCSQMQVPFGPLAASGPIRHIIAKHARAAGISATVLGSHVLRHSHAARQIDLGTPPRVVWELLGHRDPESLSAYVRIATETLREVALPCRHDHDFPWRRPSSAGVGGFPVARPSRSPTRSASFASFAFTGGVTIPPAMCPSTAGAGEGVDLPLFSATTILAGSLPLPRRMTDTSCGPRCCVGLFSYSIAPAYGLEKPFASRWPMSISNAAL